MFVESYGSLLSRRNSFIRREVDNVSAVDIECGTPGKRHGVTSDSSESAPIVVAICKVCGTRIDEFAERHAKQVPCPDCLTMVMIPCLSDVGRTNAEDKAAKSQNPDTYRLLLQPVDATPDEAAAKPRKKEFLVVCSICRARLHVEPRAEAGQIKCPDCFEFVRVPSLADAEAQLARQSVPKKPMPQVQALPVPAAPRQRRLRNEFSKAQAEIRREKPDPPPRWVFFSNVFDFPWSAGVFSRWAFLSVGLMAISMVFAGIMHILAAGSSYMLMSIAFFALPLIWIGIWTYSYATSVWITILEDTASGNVRIHNWLQQNWREWVIESCRFSMILGYAVALAHCVGYAVGMAGGDYLTAAGDTLFLAFPIMMLSALHAGSVFSPLTWPIVSSLARSWMAWLLYFVLSGLVLFGWGAVWWFGMLHAQLVVSILGGPVWAAAWLIWARLLGRLGWAIAQNEQGGAQRHRQRRASPKTASTES